MVFMNQGVGMNYLGFAQFPVPLEVLADVTVTP